MNPEEMVICNQLVKLVDEHSENGALTDNLGFEQQAYMKGLEWDAILSGFKLLGSGYFSGAFSHKDLPGKVIKVGLKKEDSGAAYAAWCRANQHLEGVPKIHHISRHASCYIVVLDKLEHLSQHVNTGEYGDYNGEVQDDDQQGLIDAYSSAKMGIYGHDNPHEEHSGVYKTCKAIAKFFSGIAAFDLHSQNIMVDPKTKKLVITDPVSFVESGLNGFDVEISTAEIAKNRRKRAARDRLEDSTLRLAMEADSHFLTKMCQVSWRYQQGFKQEVVNIHKLCIAINQLRQVTLDLDRRLDKQFLRG